MDGKKRWELLKEIYVLNQYFVSNLVILLFATIGFGTYLLNEASWAGFIYSRVHVESVLFFFDMISTVLYFVLGALGLLAYQKRKDQRIFILSNLFFLAGFAGMITDIYIYSFKYLQYQEIESLQHLLSGIERLFIVAMIYVVLFYKDKRMSKDYEWLFWIYIPTMLFTVFSAITQLSHTIPYVGTGMNHAQILFTFFEFAVTLYLAFCGFIALKRMGSDEAALMTDLFSIIILLVFGQMIMIHKGEYGEINYLVFLIYKVCMLSILVKSFYSDAILKQSLVLKKEEDYRKVLIQNLQGMLDKHTSELKLKNKQVNSELEYARVIQQSLLPPESQTFSGRVHFESGYFPCEKLSGDFYDIFQVDDEHIAMYLLDVSGHGVPAALLTMVCNNFLKSSERLIQRFRAIKPHRSIQYLYEQFNKLNFPDEMHMVIFFANYNMETNIFKYASGGLNAFPILIRADGTAIDLDDSNGFPICRLGGLFVPEYKSTEIELYPGDTLVLCTDGLIDYEKNGLFSPEELVSYVRENQHLSLYELNILIRERIYPHIGKLQDDVTYFLMRV